MDTITLKEKFFRKVKKYHGIFVGYVKNTFLILQKEFKK